MREEQQEGYDKAMESVESYVHKSIQKHQGATTSENVLNVLNDVILHTHETKLERGMRKMRVTTMSYMTTESMRGVLQ